MKIAGAPISWGVCEVPGWGYQLPADRVLREIHEVGLTATEFGPDGYDERPPLDDAGWRRLLTNLDRLSAVAAGRGIRAVLHPHVGTMIEQGPEAERVLEQDTILDAEPVGEGPVADVRRSADRLRSLLS